ncbi:LysM peptidoglycan-binding domain-containing M23 family metallopeptidase [Sulfitobacter guttiformis]|uniref:Murein DD-endopeptidase MepM/ murein hydrolase activator NlpD n=1 Tax=Sulfitobacter guttiformis TaxID=74349 RepID=A0A420DN70_9RHOB|nr:LysM peptidoglycan-binding domain-containing M23 family metallopeptidase [Sulfitobacter guttiformis]KIN72961.1 LysM domain protein/M23/M37 peptidase [Sulfitobacter guttiformis KCTC 32187]RKE95650.1 murein DD-endopeptidase MepM/ murein hydrolase activator NlpD [Sulfitobacter guttiformis]
MKLSDMRVSVRVPLLTGVACITLAACNQPLDFDMRGIGGGFSTANAAQAALDGRPAPDDRGVISYPNYQVAVARQGDTLVDVANRLGLDAPQLARFNGINPNVPLRKDEIIALPSRVAEPSPATGAIGTGPIKPVDISTVAGGAIARTPATPGVQTTTLAPLPAAKAPSQTGKEPIRHKVERGETAFTVARLYSVPAKDLAEWNGLGADFAIREGQYLLIPVPSQNPPKAAPAQSASATTLPGVGSVTPTPPSATKPLPAEKIEPAAQTKPVQTAVVTPKPVADVGKTTAPAATGKLVKPVSGTIIRDYAKGKNEGINIKAAPGTAVKAADAGTVAAITQSADGVPIIVVRHADNLLTVYANVTDVGVKRGDTVSRGQSIAKLRGGDDSFVHFEVRKGFDSVDPNPFLN